LHCGEFDHWRGSNIHNIPSWKPGGFVPPSPRLRHIHNSIRSGLSSGRVKQSFKTELYDCPSAHFEHCFDEGATRELTIFSAFHTKRLGRRISQTHDEILTITSMGPRGDDTPCSPYTCSRNNWSTESLFSIRIAERG
jgi:hypothetical protein